MHCVWLQYQTRTPPHFLCWHLHDQLADHVTYDISPHLPLRWQFHDQLTNHVFISYDNSTTDKAFNGRLSNLQFIKRFKNPPLNFLKLFVLYKLNKFLCCIFLKKTNINITYLRPKKLFINLFVHFLTDFVVNLAIHDLNFGPGLSWQSHEDNFKSGNPHPPLSLLNLVLATTSLDFTASLGINWTKLQELTEPSCRDDKDVEIHGKISWCQWTNASSSACAWEQDWT